MNLNLRGGVAWTRPPDLFLLLSLLQSKDLEFLLSSLERLLSVLERLLSSLERLLSFLELLLSQES